MSNRNAILGPIRVLFDFGTFRDLTDGQLLERFATARGEVGELAFAAVVERHGPMVLRVCRGVLMNPDDSRDAFQATFLVLVQKARGLWVRDSIGPWLHQVAFRTAKCARSNAARRKRLESTIVPEASAGSQTADDVAPILHEEIERLPERYRAPIVLCDLQGRTHEQAARHLGWPVGTVKSRQSRARDRLRERLQRRGVAPSLAALALRPSLSLIVPPVLAEPTARAAIQSLVPGASVVGSTAAILAMEVAKAMAMTRWWKLAAAAMVAGATVSGVPLLAMQDKPGGDDAKAVVKAGSKDDAKVTTVQPRKLREVISERGMIEFSKKNDVICEVEGQTTILSIVPEGTAVKQNDLVAELDSSTIRDQLVNQEIATKKAIADLDIAEKSRNIAKIAVHEYLLGTSKHESGSLHRAIQTTESGIQRATSRIQRIEAAQARLKEVMAARKDISPADIVAEVDLADRLAEAGQDREERADAKADAIGKFEVFESYTRKRVITELEATVKRSESDELAKKATYELELAKEKKLKKQIEKCKIYATTDGIVVYANDVQSIRGQNHAMIEEGATVRERQKLFSIADLGGPMRVNTKVREAIVDRLAVGQTVKVVVDALPDQTLTGVVRKIQPLPDAGTYNSGDIKFYTTLIDLVDHPKSLRPGMTAKADILVNEADEGLAVPVSAVVNYDGKWQVAVKTDGGHEWRVVTTGLYDGKRDMGSHENLSVEIKTGLKPGESVFVDPLSLMTDEEKKAHLSKPRPAPAKAQGLPPKPN